MIYIPDIPLIDFDAQQRARDHFAQQSAEIGPLESLAIRLATIQGNKVENKMGNKGVVFDQKHIVLIGADQGHVAADPDRTTALMEQIVSGDGVIHDLAKKHKATLTLADIGMQRPFSHPSVQSLRVAQCADMAAGAALAITEVNDAFMVGMNIGSMQISVGMNVLAAGAVTSNGGVLPAIAVTAVLGEANVADLMAEYDPFDLPLTVPAQIELVEHAIKRNKPERIDVIDVIRCVGSAEIAAIAGLMLVAAAGQVPILIDGLITAAAAYTAASLNPAVRFSFIAGGVPIHPAHTFILKKLGLRPILSAATGQKPAEGGATAFAVVDQAAALLKTNGVK